MLGFQVITRNEPGPVGHQDGIAPLGSEPRAMAVDRRAIAEVEVVR